VQRDISVRACTSVSADAPIAHSHEMNGVPLTRTSALVFGATAGMAGQGQRISTTVEDRYE
jgi:hypothetical protein